MILLNFSNDPIHGVQNSYAGHVINLDGLSN
jgi:hypothetical protein